MAGVSRLQIGCKCQVRGTRYAHDRCFRRRRRVDRARRLLPSLAAGLHRNAADLDQVGRSPDNLRTASASRIPAVGSRVSSVESPVLREKPGQARAFSLGPSRLSACAQKPPCAQVLIQKNKRMTAPPAPAATSTLSQLRFLSASAISPPWTWSSDLTQKISSDTTDARHVKAKQKRGAVELTVQRSKVGP